MQTFDQFIQDWKGETPGYDGVEENIGQCVQLFNFYNRDVVGAPDWWIDYAHELYTRFDENSPLYPYYDKIEYTSGATPERGCVVVYSPKLPGTKGAGHVDMCTIPGAITYEAFSCNWGGKQAHLVEHDFSYVLGWLRPKGGNKVITDNGIRALFLAILKHPANNADLAFYRGKTWEKVVDELTNLGEYAKVNEQYHLGAEAPALQKQVQTLGIQLGKYQAMNGDATKWQTLMTLLGLNK